MNTALKQTIGLSVSCALIITGCGKGGGLDLIQDARLRTYVQDKDSMGFRSLIYGSDSTHTSTSEQRKEQACWDSRWRSANSTRLAHRCPEWDSFRRLKSRMASKGSRVSLRDSIRVKMESQSSSMP